MKRLLTLLIALFPIAAEAQTVTNPALAAMVCAYNSVTPTPVSGQFFYVQCDVSGRVMTNAVPGGSDGAIQYNNNGVFGGAAQWSYSSSTGFLTGGQLFVSQSGLTGGPSGSAWITKQSPNTKSYMQVDLDEAGRTTRTYDQASGRMDLFGNDSAGPAMVIALNKSSAPANGDNLGHYAFRGKDSNLNFNTYAYVLSAAAVVDAAGLSSSFTLGAMRNVVAGAGNAQPNYFFIVNGSSNTVTFPTGAAILSSGNHTVSAATGPLVTLTNSANSRNLLLGLTDNFNGFVNATGGAQLNLQSTGTTGITVTSAANRLILTTTFGPADAASPAAQTTGVQSVLAGTADANGANWTIKGSLSTGSGTSGDIIFQTGGTGAGSTSLNTATTALSIKGATQTIRVASGKALQLGNTYAAGVVVPAGSLLITDDAGNVYKISACLASGC